MSPHEVELIPKILILAQSFEIVTNTNHPTLRNRHILDEGLLVVVLGDSRNSFWILMVHVLT